MGMPFHIRSCADANMEQRFGPLGVVAKRSSQVLGWWWSWCLRFNLPDQTLIIGGALYLLALRDCAA